MTESLLEEVTPQLAGARVVVAGLGRTGQAVVRFLSSQGASVTASDRREEKEIGDVIAELRALGATIECGGNREATFSGAELVIASPGVPLSSPAVVAARTAGVPIWAEVELAARFLRGPLIGITGSNGKSTVTTMTAHLLRSADIDAVACGNLGTPLIEFASEDLPGRRYVAELSSFQLEGIERLHPRIAVLTNLSPDHLDRYGTFEAYAAAKKRIFSNQVRGDDAVINADDPMVAAASRGGAATLRRFSLSGPVEDGAWVANGALHLSIAGKDEEMLDVEELPLQGLHNVENALAASLTANLAGACLSDIEDGLRSFKALPHRMEFVLELDGVAYYNDSKATNVGATQRVIQSMDRMLVLILGGRDKGGDFSTLAELLPPRVRHVVLMGEARGTIAQAISGRVPVMEVENLAEAVEAARVAARSGDAVLLAPACASFDAYRSFEERGEHFRRLVLALRKRRIPREDHPYNRRSDG